MTALIKTLSQPLTKTIVSRLYREAYSGGFGQLLSKQVIFGKNVKPRLEFKAMSDYDCSRPIMGFQTAFKDGKPVKVKYLIPEK